MKLEHKLTPKQFNKFDYIEYTPEQIASIGLLNKAIEENKTIYKVHKVGKVKEGFNFESVIRGNLLYVPNKTNICRIYLSNYSVLSVSLNSVGILRINGYSMDKEYVDFLDKLELDEVPEVSKTGYVFAITENHGNLGLANIGLAGIKLNEGNYSKKVIEDYKYIVKDLNSKYPSGRISIFEGPPGCHRKGQEILMFDGSIKKVEDIIVGDKLMGPDSLPRKVLNLSIGNEEMVEIIPNKGENWVVNKNHILSLVYSGKDKDGEVLDVNIQDWNNWSNDKKERYKLFKTAVNFKNNKSLPIDPYLLGILIGDGSVTQDTPIITTKDKEIVDFLKFESAKHGMQVNRRQYGSKCATYSIVRQKRSKKINPLIKKIRELNLGVKCENKFIPFEYKTASRDDRLQLLAGLIDSDGHLKDNGFEFITKSEQLSKDVAFLARSLGFSAYPKKCFKKAQTGNGNYYYRMFINGDTKLIPTIISRKIVKNERKQIKNVLRTGFKINNLPSEDYYGFTLDGDGRFLLGDFTVTHNTGKTHLIKSLLMEASNGMFVIISPDMVKELSGPKFLPLLLQYKGHAKNGPIILILEDADKCLVKRGEENMPSIQALLNLGDGILGSLLDIRIVATTNANKLEMEEAMMRPGRLSKRIEVSYLSYTEAANVFNQLVPNAECTLSVKDHSLAEVYEAARKSGWEPIEPVLEEDDDEQDNIVEAIEEYE